MDNPFQYVWLHMLLAQTTPAPPLFASVRVTRCSAKTQGPQPFLPNGLREQVSDKAGGCIWKDRGASPSFIPSWISAERTLESGPWAGSPGLLLLPPSHCERKAAVGVGSSGRVSVLLLNCTGAKNRPGTVRANWIRGGGQWSTAEVTAGLPEWFQN